MLSTTEFNEIQMMIRDGDEGLADLMSKVEVYYNLERSHHYEKLTEVDRVANLSRLQQLVSAILIK